MLVHTLLVVATTAQTFAAGIPNNRFGMGDLSNAMGASMGEEEAIDDQEQFFEPQFYKEHRKEVREDGLGPFPQELPEQDASGFEALDIQIDDCGSHGCAQPSVLTVVSGQGTRSETTDGTTSLSRSPQAGFSLWTVQQAPNSCSLSWFNASWPLVSSFEVQPQVYGIESCVNSPGSVWFGMFQFEDSHAVDQLFESICQGNLDLRWTLLGDHLERIAPSKTLNPAAAQHQQSLAVPNLQLGPTDTASAPVATRKHLEASGTVFMVVRNGCSGPATLEIKQSLMARVELSLANTFDILDAIIVALVIGASAMFVYSAMLLCEAMKTCEELEDIMEDELDGDELLAKVCSLPSKVRIERSSSADSTSSADEQPLLKALR